MYAVPLAMGTKPKVSGFLVAVEIEYLSDVIKNPKRPFVAILGGAKVSDKINVIRKLLDKADTLLIGGAMAYTFFLAKGKQVGKSLVEKDKVDLAKELLEKAGGKTEAARGHVIATMTSMPTATRRSSRRATSPPAWKASTSARKPRSSTPKDRKSPRPSSGTARWACSRSSPSTRGPKPSPRRWPTSEDATSIIGGGDSAAAIEQMGLADKVSHVSTGGGASLEMLEGKEFAAVNILDDK